MYLGIDIGTSSVKTVVIDGDQQIVGTASVDLAVNKPAEGWSEQDPDSWNGAVIETIDHLATRFPRQIAATRGIGLSGQMHGATALDNAHRPMRPAILWNDTRSATECEAMEARLPASRKLAGNIAMPGFTAPKIEWMRRHEPQLYDRIALVLLPKDYVRLHLTGDAVSEMSDAAGTLWLDVSKRDWSEALLANTGLTREHMPALVEGSAASAVLRRDLSDRWGMSTSPVIAGGGGDNAASACGVGVVRPGNGFVSLGTSGVLFVSNAAYSPNTDGAVHAFCHALPSIWHQMGVILSATDSLNWVAGLTGTPAADLAQHVDASADGPASSLFLPYLSGERTPHNDATIRGAVTGISHLSDATSLAHAVMDGVAFAFKDCQRVLVDAGASIDGLLAVGGGARSSYWLRTLATLLDVPILIPKDGDFGAAFGAARLGLCAAENADPLAVCVQPEIAAEIAPDAEQANAYAAKYLQYRQLYPAVKSVG